MKTSVTLSEDIVRAIDRLAGPSKNRSAVIERAVREYVRAHAKQKRDERDLEIYDRHAVELSREALDALAYQIPFETDV